MAKDINSDAMSNLLQGLTSDNEAATASSSSKKDDNVKSDKRKKPSGKVKSEINPIAKIRMEMEIAITGRLINIFPFIL